MKNQSIEGLKGIACLIVAFNHFCNLYGHDGVISADIYKIIYPVIHGSYMVYVFIGISFYFVAQKVYENSEINYTYFAVKKYLRLALPLFFLCIIIFVLYKLGAFNHLSEALKLSGGGDQAIHYESSGKLINVFLVPFFKCLFISTDDFAFPLWMLNYIFLGAFITLIIALIYKKMSLWLAIVVTISLWYCMSVYLKSTFFSLAPIFALIAYIKVNASFKTLECWGGVFF